MNPVVGNKSAVIYWGFNDQENSILYLFSFPFDSLFSTSFYRDKNHRLLFGKNIYKFINY